jgi:hypothetical protein
MNSSVYFFGELGQGYTQSPDDGTRNLLETFFAKGQKGSRLSFVHEGKLAYYGYTRPLKAQGTYFGICCVFNDVFCKDYEGLFTLFEEAITHLVVEGKVLGFDESGDVVPVVDWLYQASTEIGRASERVLNQLQRMEAAFVKLPPVNYATASAETRVYTLEDNQWSVMEDMEKYPRVVVTKDYDIDSQSLASFSGRLNSLHSQMIQLEKDKDKLDDELNKVKRQKKRSTMVIILMLILALTGLALYQVLVKSNERKETIFSQNETITRLESEKSEIEMDLENERYRYDTLFEANIVLQTAHKELQTVCDSLCKVSFVTGANHYLSEDTSFDNSYVMWLYASEHVEIQSFYVKADKTGTLAIGLFTENGDTIATTKANVHENRFVKVNPSNFKLEGKNYGYLAIYSNEDNIKLSYHTAKENEFAGYKNYGALRIKGCSTKGKDKSEMQQRYYQYFYDLKYKLDINNEQTKE